MNYCNDVDMRNLEEAGPLVLQVLRQACSQDSQTLKPAENQLRTWESRPGFYTVLHAIFSNFDVELTVRWLAVLYLKNGVDRYWRRNAPQGISAEEKMFLRSKLISNFDEPVNQIAIQLAVLTGKIARLDFPHNWRELFPTLLTAVRCGVPHQQHRALLTFHHVTKFLASKRLAHDRKIFVDLTAQIFEDILSMWIKYTDLFHEECRTGTPDLSTLTLLFDYGHLSLKILRKLVVYGFRDLSGVARTFMERIFQELEKFMEGKKLFHQLSTEFLLKREKMIILLTKILLECQENHEIAYLPYLSPSLQFIIKYAFGSDNQITFERFIVNMFNLMRAVLRCDVYVIPESGAATPSVSSCEANHILKQFFTYNNVTGICHRLVLDFMPFSGDDLMLWDTNPQDFVSGDIGDSWKFSLRPCVDSLYLTLFKKNRNHMNPIVINLLKESMSLSDASDLAQVLRKDAIYNAVGQAAFELYDEVDFDGWFQSQLIHEFGYGHSNHRILRRRLIWLFGCWLGVKFSVEHRPQLYHIITKLLKPEEDLVVKIEAAHTLKIAVDDFEFSTETFLPFLGELFGLLFKLLQAVNECETKMQVLHVMSYIIERVGGDIKPHVQDLISYLPVLWIESAEHNMLRCAIVTSLTSLVQGLGSDCVRLYDLLIPIISLSTDVTHDAHVYLLEDAMELWYFTLICSSGSSPELNRLYGNVGPLLELGSETFSICIKVTEAMLLLAPNEFMSAYSEGLIKSLMIATAELKSEGVVTVLKIMETMMVLFPSQAPVLMAQQLRDSFNHVVNRGRNPMEMAMHMCLLSRLMLTGGNIFVGFLEKEAESRRMNMSQTLDLLLSEWFDKTDNLIHSEMRKLCVMGFLSLLSLQLSPIVHHFPSIIAFSVETLHDICNVEGKTIVDDLLLKDVDQEEYDTEHNRRYVRMQANDPVYSTYIIDFMKKQLSNGKNSFGEAVFGEAMSRVDREILHQMSEFIS